MKKETTRRILKKLAGLIAILTFCMIGAVWAHADGCPAAPYNGGKITVPGKVVYVLEMNTGLEGASDASYTSEDPSVVRIVSQYVWNMDGVPLCTFEGVKGGSTNIVASVTYGSGKKTIKIPVEVVNYFNPLKQFKIGNTDVSARFDHSIEGCYTGTRGNQTITYAVESGWNIKVSYGYWEDHNYKSFSIPSGGKADLDLIVNKANSCIYIVMKNTARNMQIEDSLYITDREGTFTPIPSIAPSVQPTPTPAPAGQSKVTGTVKDTFTGNTLSGADVKARSGKNNKTGTIIAQTKSDAKGQYTLNLPKGDYTLSFTKKDFKNYYVNVAVSAGNPVSSQGKMTPAQFYKIAGTVMDSGSGKSVTSATVEARSGKNNQTGKVLATTKTDGKGQYALSLPKGDFTLTVKKKDFRNYYAMVSVSGNKTQTLPVIKSSAPLYKLNAIVSDAENGKMLKNASVQVRSGKNNKTGYVIASAKSSSKGKFNLPIYKGNYTLAVSLNNYITLYCNVNLSGNKTISLPLTKKLSSSQYRVVLSWGKSPADLDLHATGPKSSTGYSRFHVYWNGKTFTSNGVQTAKLNMEDKDAYGPETITLNLSKGKNGTYHFYVHNVKNTKNSNELAKSGARVEIYNGSKLLASYAVPNKNGRVWRVFDLVNGKLKAVNTMSDDTGLLTK